MYFSAVLFLAKLRIELFAPRRVLGALEDPQGQRQVFLLLFRPFLIAAKFGLGRDTGIPRAV